MNDINDVRTSLVEVFNNLRTREISTKEASELVNCAGKIISTLKVELEFYALSKQQPDIPFLSNKAAI